MQFHLEKFLWLAILAGTITQLALRIGAFIPFIGTFIPLPVRPIIVRHYTKRTLQINL
jgi:hypothetical protein